jgi:hypothetical protein
MCNDYEQHILWARILQSDAGARPRDSDVKLTALVARNARKMPRNRPVFLMAVLIGNDTNLRIAYGNNP